MKVVITRAEIQQLQEKAKVHSYLQSILTKTYIKVGPSCLTLYFCGIRGGFKQWVKLGGSGQESPMTYLIDYAKWLNALNKLVFSDKIILNATSKSITLSVEGSTDSIALGVTHFAEDSTESLMVDSFIENTLETKNINIEKNIDGPMLESMQIANMMFSSVCKNNTLALNNNRVMYADRSIILEISHNQTNEPGDEVYLHKYTVGLISLVSRLNSRFFFDEDFNFLYWNDETSKLVIASEPREIAFPSKEDIQALTPSANTFEVSQAKLLSGLDFFNGFYASSSWKPITLTEVEEGLLLNYAHPTAEISKVVDITSTSETRNVSFSIMSEMLEKLLERSNELIPDELATFTYDENGAGVLCTVGSMYTIIFAKITL